MLTSKRAQFTLPRSVTYLNCAYMAPLMKTVEKAGIKGLRSKRNPVGIKPNDFYTDTETLRLEYAKLINTKEANRIVTIPSVSYGLATVARNLHIKKEQHIIVAGEQFPSNYYPWQSLCEETGASVKIISAPENFVDRGKRWNERILEAIDSNTRAVAIAHFHWADGTRFDLQAIRQRTKEVGALLIVDGTQSVGAVPFDIQKIQPDALVCAGYKWLLGPYSIGLAYYGDYFNNGKPIEESWINRKDSEDFAGLVAYQRHYQLGMLRYEVGEHSNFILVPMMIKAIEQLNKWGVNRIQEYCQSITTESISRLRERGFIVEDEGFRGSHLFGIRLPAGVDLKAVKTTLLKHKVYVSYRGNVIRVAPNVYNTENDLQKLVRVMSSVL
ncbi:MAG: aminotransferase class V-fold PLP-dependent enzyme [Cyclobacteriaceae bacterium]